MIRRTNVPPRVAPALPAPHVVWIVLGALAVALLVGIAMRNAMFYPTVLADEYIYSIDARLRPLAQAVRQGYVFLAVYRTTAWCEDGFLGCARVLDLAFFAAGCAFVVLCARRFLSWRAAAWVGLLALAGPFNTYTAYFIPESMYFCGFWLLMWAALGLEPDSRARRWALVGTAAGALALVKPHGLFLLPAVIVYAAALRPAAEPALAWTAKRLGLVVAGFCVVKFGVGGLVAGRAGLALFGSEYGGQATAMLGNGGVQERIGWLAALLWGHAMAVLFIGALPVATALWTLVGPGRAPRGSVPWKIAAMALLVLASLVGVASVFTAAVADMGVYETANRLHMRYYNFALPLLTLVAATALVREGGGKRWRTAAAVLMAALVVFVVVDAFQGYASSIVDSPDIQGLVQFSAMRRLFGLLMLLSLVLWVRSPRHGAIVYCFVLMPWFAWQQMTKTARDGVWMPGPFDRAGIVARQLIPKPERARLRVMTDDEAGAFRVLFQVDDPSAVAVRLRPAEPVTEANWPGDGAWAVVVGDHRIDVPAVERIELGDFVLLHRRDAH